MTIYIIKDSYKDIGTWEIRKKLRIGFEIENDWIQGSKKSDMALNVNYHRIFWNSKEFRNFLSYLIKNLWRDSQPAIDVQVNIAG